MMRSFIYCLLIFSLTHIVSFAQGVSCPFPSSNSVERLQTPTQNMLVLIDRHPRENNPYYKAFLVGLRLQDTITDMFVISRNLDQILLNQNGCSTSIYHTAHAQNFRHEEYVQTGLGVELGSVFSLPAFPDTIWGCSGGLLTGASHDMEYRSRLLSIAYYFSLGGECPFIELYSEDLSATNVSIFGKVVYCRYLNVISNEYSTLRDNVGDWTSLGALAEVGLHAQTITPFFPRIAGIGHIKLQAIRTSQKPFIESSVGYGRAFSSSFFRAIDLPIGSGIEFFLDENNRNNVFSLEGVITIGMKRNFSDSVIVYRGEILSIVSPTEWDPLVKTDVHFAYRGQILKAPQCEFLFSLGSRRNLKGKDSVYSKTSYPVNIRFASEWAF
ncbi:hypothetical protein [Chlamydia sp. 17-3921]|uniref:hypothetical protein n=1 Tax=Chlamydia sp. 17-3921 TaxID=2675798 RepID=UPI001918275C|nr:hypothetical protein [Chlamydia sp. 17-3921]